MAAHLHRFRLELRQIDAGNHLSMHHQQQTIAEQQVWQYRVGVLALDHRIDGIADRLKLVEPLNLADHIGR